MPVAGVLRSAPAQLLMPVGGRALRDLLDYASAGMLSRSVLNIAGREASILAIDSTRVELQTGPGRVLTVQMMPLKKDSVICVIETLKSDFADSQLKVYDRNWQPLPKLWAEPAPSAWGKVDAQEPPIVMAEYSLDPASGILTLINTSEEREKMRPTLRYQWSTKGFKPIKDK